MNFAEYRAIPDAVNWSTLRELSKSAADYKYALTNPQPDTPAMARGRLVHCAALEPDELPERYAVWPGTRHGRDWTAFKVAEIDAGKEIVTVAEYERALAIRDAVRGNVNAGALLASGLAETTRQWVDSATGLACKCRIDYLISESVLVDLKTTQSIRQRDFARSCANYQYHGQLAFYARSLPSARLYLIAVESEPPHDVVVYEPDDDMLWAGDCLVDDLLAKLKTCMDTDTWPGMYEGVQALSLPAWVFDDIEEGSK